MNPPNEDLSSHPDILPEPAETRLEKSRAALRERLNRERATKTSDPLGKISELASMATPVARQWVRQHPYVSLSAAALTGVALVRLKPGRGIGGSLLAGLLARQALALSLSRAFDWLLNAVSGPSSPQVPTGTEATAAATHTKQY